jgi:hypothetical protein
VGFNKRKPQESAGVYRYFCIGFSYTSMGHRRDSCGHTQVTMGKVVDIHRSEKRHTRIPENCAIIDCTMGHPLPG